MNNKEIHLGTIHHMPTILNDGLTFILMLRGTITLECEHTVYQLKDSDIAVINDGDFYSLTSNDANILVMLHFPKQYLTVYFPQFSQYRFDCISCSSSTVNDFIYDSLRKYVAKLSFIYFKNEDGSELLFQSVLLKILHHLVTAFATVTIEAKQTTEGKHLKFALEYIHLHFKNRIQLEDIAKHVFISTQHLSRLFRTILNTSSLEYINTLRVSSAKHDLLHSNATVTKIAMINGFASDKALNTIFVKKYGMTPHEYRKAHQMKRDEKLTGNRMTFLTEGQDNALETLVRSIEKFERVEKEQPSSMQSFDLNQIECSSLSRFSSIVDIGDIEHSLRADCRQQLHIVKQHLDVKYIAFGGLLSVLDAAERNYPHFKLYDVFEMLSLFRSLEMVPFIRLELNGLQKERLKPLLTILDTLKLRYSEHELSEWHFEAIGNEDALREFYPSISASLHSRITNIHVGIRVLTDSMDESQIQQTLADLTPYTIDFLSITANPNMETAPTELTAYEAFQRNYHVNKVQQLRLITERAGLKNLPLFLTDWNTLTGSTIVEAGEFHRTALIADSLRMLSSLVEGLSIRLSLPSNNEEETDIITHPLSLFIYQNIQRPMFFVFRAYASLKERVIAQGQGYILTCDIFGNFALLLYNACYMNPFLALDNIRQSNYTQNFSYRLTGVSPSHYRVKKYLMDKGNGSLYSSWLRMDISAPLEDEDIDDYLENASNPSVMLYEEMSTSEIIVNQELSMNATALFIFKRYNSPPHP